MSNISIEKIDESKAAQPKPSLVSRPKSQVMVRAKLVSYPQKRQRAKARRVESYVGQAVLLCFMIFTSYGVSSIAGQVMVEQSRREEERAQTITLKALSAETSLRSHLQKLKDPQTVLAWATEHHFTNSPAFPKKPDVTPSLVALRD